MVRPSQRREMAQSAVVEGRATIRHACQTFAVSQTCFRYKAKASEDNAQIVDWLVRLKTAHRDWGAVLSVPAQCEGAGWNHRRGLSNLPRVGVEPVDQAEEVAGSGKARVASRTADHQPGRVDGLHA
ncbi:hypothetical isxac2 transposase orfb (fragment) protein [Xanthomonas albilineans GPE PC73]|uniref:Hypothetical isxac2 transposase orfb protein n=1 Tax=Xanthomonas albilineans (strain GPE PC73 / CFBP 7063) TaxID=380358 RepID=D2UE89_XANAP